MGSSSIFSTSCRPSRPINTGVTASLPSHPSRNKSTVHHRTTSSYTTIPQTTSVERRLDDEIVPLGATESERSMDPEMFNLFPDGIRVLLVDDDSRFIRKASTLLSLLNFNVSTCGSPSSALKILSEVDKFRNVDAVLVDAKKATTCGFDFRTIVETDLRIPVVYFLSENHKSTGAEADELLRTLNLAGFVLKKPFDSDEICNLWRDIAWRKCCLNSSKTGAAAAGNVVGQGSSSGGGGKRPMPPWAGSSSSFSDDREEERVHFRVISGARCRKRKGVVNNNAGGSSSAPVPAARRRGRPPKNRQQTDVAGHQQETVDRVAEESGSKKAKKNGNSASMPDVPEDMDAEPQPPQPKQSLFVQSVLQTLDVPPYNPSIFADAVERGANIISFSAAGKTTAVAPASPPLHQQAAAAPATPAASQALAPPPANRQAPQAPAPPPVHQAPQAPAPPPVHQAPLAPAPAAVCPAPAPAPPVVHRQQQTPAVNVIGNAAQPAPETITSTAFTVNKEADFSNLLLCGAFGPFPYQGPPPPAAMQQDMFAPRNFPTGDGNIQVLLQQPPNIDTGDPFTFTAGAVGGATIGAADDATHAGGDYGNTANTLMQPLQLADATLQDEVAGMMAMYSPNPHLMAPQHVDDVAAMYDYNNNNNNAAMYYDNNGELFVVPDQVQHGMAYDVNNPVMAAGGAFDGNAAASMAPTVNNQLGMGDDPAASSSMFASDGNGDYSFPLEALMGTDWPMYEYDDAGLAGQQGGSAEAEGAAASVDAAGIYLNAGEGSSMGPDDEIAAMLDEMLMNNAGSDLFSHYMNNDLQ